MPYERISYSHLTIVLILVVVVGPVDTVHKRGFKARLIIICVWIIRIWCSGRSRPPYISHNFPTSSVQAALSYRLRESITRASYQHYPQAGFCILEQSGRCARYGQVFVQGYPYVGRGICGKRSCQQVVDNMRKFYTLRHDHVLRAVPLICSGPGGTSWLILLCRGVSLFTSPRYGMWDSRHAESQSPRTAG